MAAGQIAHMDIIPHAGSIRRIVVVTEDIYLRKPPDRDAGDIRKQIVRNSLRILADQTALVGTDRIEVAQEHDIPQWIRRVNVRQNLLDHPFRPSVRVCARAFFLCLGKRHRIVRSVNRRGGAENNIMYAVTAHLVAENERAGDVVGVIFHRLLHGLADRFQTGEVDNGIDRLAVKQVPDLLPVQNIRLIKHRTFPGDRLDAVDHLAACVKQVVQNHDLVALIQQLHACVASDITGPAGNQNSHNFSPFLGVLYLLGSADDRQTRSFSLFLAMRQARPRSRF